MKKIIFILAFAALFSCDSTMTVKRSPLPQTTAQADARREYNYNVLFMLIGSIVAISIASTFRRKSKAQIRYNKSSDTLTIERDGKTFSLGKPGRDNEKKAKVLKNLKHNVKITR